MHVQPASSGGVWYVLSFGQKRTYRPFAKSYGTPFAYGCATAFCTEKRSDTYVDEMGETGIVLR